MRVSCRRLIQSTVIMNVRSSNSWVSTSAQQLCIRLRAKGRVKGQRKVQIFQEESVLL